MGVFRALKNLQVDFIRVSGKKPELYPDSLPDSKSVIIAGIIGESEMLNQPGDQDLIQKTGNM